MHDKRISGLNRGGWRRHGDPPAWLDPNLPLEQRRQLLDEAIRAVSRCSQQSAHASPAGPEAGQDEPAQPPLKQVK